MGNCFVGLAKSCKFAENLQNEVKGMKYITLPTSEVRRLSFYLAMEEYVARHLDEPDCFFLWQVSPSVIFGRNQVLENEVNVDYCRAHGIRLYRRKSGGGCVYADMDNLMWSFITSEENVNFAFNRFINMVLLVLRKMGIECDDRRQESLWNGLLPSGGQEYRTQHDALRHEHGAYASRHHTESGETAEERHRERPTAHHPVEGLHFAAARRREDVDTRDPLPRLADADTRRGG